MAKKTKLKDNDFFNEKKLNAVMKRFLNGKKEAPEQTKWYYCEGGVNFYATTLGSSVQIAFTNRFENSYNKKTNENFFVQPAKEPIVADYIPEYVEVGKGKDKKVMPTGNAVEFPDVKGLFSKFNIKHFKRILITKELADEMNKLNETIISLMKLGGMYAGAFLYAKDNKLTFGVDDVKGLKSFEYEIEFIGDKFNEQTLKFHYDPNYMTAILKTLKDLKAEKTIMYLSDTDPILFYGKDIEYIYKFAMQRKLVPEEMK